MINFDLYSTPFLVALLTSSFCSLFIILVAQTFFGRKNSKEKDGSIFRMGGVAIIFSFIFAVLINEDLAMTSQIAGIIVASLFILLFGVMDDLFNLDWRTQLFFQVCVAMIVFIAGANIGYVSDFLSGLKYLNIDGVLLWNLFFGVFWVVFLMNAVNWLDGLDGLSGGVGLIAALSIFFLVLKPEVNQPPIGLIMMALVGALLGFLVFNFHPSRIMAGTSGSFFIGFVLAAISIIAGTKVATTFVVLSIAVLDVFGVIYQRIRSGDSAFEADRRHLHHKLLEIGWSETKISLFFYALTGLIAIFALNTNAVGKMITLGGVFVIMIFMNYYTNRILKKN